MTAPSLRFAGASRDVRAVVLMLHGGQEDSTEPVLSRHASWWRIALLQNSVAAFAAREHIAVGLLKNRLRGWNAIATRGPDPVQDARWALERIRRTYPGSPVVLVGHSMGGRTACRVAEDPSVVGVCALAPWLPPEEDVAALAGRRLAVLHGTRDRWTSPAASRAYVARALPVADAATWGAVDGAGHFMLRNVRTWNGFVCNSMSGMLR